MRNFYKVKTMENVYGIKKNNKKYMYYTYVKWFWRRTWFFYVLFLVLLHTLGQLLDIVAPNTLYLYLYWNSLQSKCKRIAMRMLTYVICIVRKIDCCSWVFMCIFLFFYVRMYWYLYATIYIQQTILLDRYLAELFFANMTIYRN